MSNNTIERLYSLAEAAQFLGVHVNTARNWVKDGRLKAVQPGRDYKVSGEEIVRLGGIIPSGESRNGEGAA